MVTKTVQAFLDDLCLALNRDPGSLALTDTKETIPEWDSIGHLAILATVDAELEVPVDSDEMRTFTSLRSMIDRLTALGALHD